MTPSELATTVAAGLDWKSSLALGEAGRRRLGFTQVIRGGMRTPRLQHSCVYGSAAKPDGEPGAWQEGFLLSVLVPVYNERRTLETILSRIRAVAIPHEIILVDDGSTDSTRDLLRDTIEGSDPGIRVLYHEQNRGKGAAVRTAIEAARGTVCVIQDADLEYDPADYDRLLKPILDGRADAVFGSRFVGSEAHRVHLFWHSLGNRVLTTFSNMLTNLNLTDMETCYKMVRTDLLQSLPLRAERFDLEPELTALLAKAGARIYEVSISYSGRDYSEGKKITWRDGVHAIWAIFAARFRKWDDPKGWRKMG